MRKLTRPLAALAFVALICLDPAGAAAAAREALARWSTQVAPALLPFLIAIPALTCEEGLAFFGRAAGGFMRFMRCPARFASAWLTGLLSGSPAGAAALAACAGSCGNGELLRGALLCSGASPAFLLSAIGAGMLSDPQAGWTLIGAQLLATFTTGLLMRPLPDTAPCAPNGAGGRPDPPAIQGAAQSLLMIGCYMTLFAVLTDQLTRLLGPAFRTPLAMLLELSGGCRAALALPLPAPQRLAVTAAVACMGGASVCAQSLSFLTPLGVRPAPYVFWKLAQCGFCALYALLLTACLPEMSLRAASPDIMPAILCAALLALAAATAFRRAGSIKKDGKGEHPSVLFQQQP